MKRLLTILGATLFAGCTHQVAPQPQAQIADPVIVRIVSRNTTITARAGANGVVYSVQDKQGEQLVPSMTLNQLQAAAPDVAQKIKVMRADDASAASAWAGM